MNNKRKYVVEDKRGISHKLMLNYDPVRYVRENGKSYHKLRMYRCLYSGGEDVVQYQEELIQLQNSDGGWPWTWEQGHPSGMAETARAVEILMSEGEDKRAEYIRRAVEMMFDLQELDGGWTENKELKDHIPKEWDWMNLNYSCTWITASIVAALVRAGFEIDERVRKGLAFIHSTQKEDGGWSTHVGPDYRYGPDLASMDDILRTLISVGERISEPVLRLEKCLLSHRDDWKIPAFTVSVLAMLYLLDCPRNSEQVREVIELLIARQREDGGWSWFEDAPSDPWYTCLCVEQLSLFGISFG